MNKKIIISLILVLLWMFFIFFMSNMDRDNSDNKSMTIATGIVDKVDKITKASDEVVKYHHEEEFVLNINNFFRKCAHVFEYFVLSLLVLNFLFQLNKFQYLTCSIINVIFSFLYACSDEFHQTFISGRGGQFRDVLIDTIGILLGCIIFFFGYKIIKNRKNAI